MTTLERDIENRFVRWCAGRGFQCLKLAPSVRGFPDRTVLCPDGRTVFVEFKRDDGTLSPHQVEWIGKLKRLGFTVGVCRSVAEAVELVEGEL